MAKFSGVSGREWDVHLTLGKIRDIKIKCGIDLLEPWDGELLVRLAGNVLVFAEVMAIVIPLSDAVEAELLANDLRGDSLDAAVSAFLEELSLFFVAGDRSRFLLLYRKIMELMTMSLPAIEKKVNDAISETLETQKTSKRK